MRKETGYVCVGRRIDVGEKDVAKRPCHSPSLGVPLDGFGEGVIGDLPLEEKD